MAKVLITGGTGFIASHCIQQLLKAGYNVTTTVRSTSKGEQLASTYSPSLKYAIVPDISQPGAFDTAVQTPTGTPGFDFVVHTASPFHYNVSDPVKDFLEPAIQGTTSLLAAVHAHAHSVKRIVLLSSFAAIRDDECAPGTVFNEDSWNPVTWERAVKETKKTYQGSKTLSERAAWSFLATHHPSFTLTSINPTLVFGPVPPHLTSPSALNTSNARFLALARGEWRPALPPTGFYTWVDVRDVCAGLISAMQSPHAENKRFLLAEGRYSNKRIAEVVQGMGMGELLPEGWEGVQEDGPEEGEGYGVDSSRSREVLGVRYRGLEECVRDTLGSLGGLGVRLDMAGEE